MAAAALFAAGCAQTDPQRCQTYGGTVGDMDRTHSVATGDLDGDGYTDLAAVRQLDSCVDDRHETRVFVYRQDRGRPGRFLAPQSYPLGHEGGHLLLADVDGDGRTDMVATGEQAVSILLQSAASPGTFQPTASFGFSGRSVADVAAADLDGDEDMDLLAGSFVRGFRETLFHALLQDPLAQGGFATVPMGGPLAAGVPAMELADLDLDGNPELLAALNQSRDTHLGVLHRDPRVPFFGFLPAQSYPVAALDLAELAVVRLNLDDLVDIVMLSSSSDPAGAPLVHVLLGDPASPGAFLGPQTYQGCPFGDGLAVRDVNGDTMPDIIVTGSQAHPAPRCVAVLQQEPAFGGTFGAPVVMTIRKSQLWNYSADDPLAAADLNGDGLVDVAVVEQGLVILFQRPGSPGVFNEAERLYDDS